VRQTDDLKAGTRLALRRPLRRRPPPNPLAHGSTRQGAANDIPVEVRLAGGQDLQRAGPCPIYPLTIETSTTVWDGNADSGDHPGTGAPTSIASRLVG